MQITHRSVGEPAEGSLTRIHVINQCELFSPPPSCYAGSTCKRHTSMLKPLAGGSSKVTILLTILTPPYTSCLFICLPDGRQAGGVRHVYLLER